MKASNALVAAALAGVFAATTAVSAATFLPGDKDKDDCPGKDKEKKEEVISGDKEKDKDDCPDKEKKEEVISGDKDKDKDDCPDKDKDDCPGKDKEKEEIL